MLLKGTKILKLFFFIKMSYSKRNVGIRNVIRNKNSIAKVPKTGGHKALIKVNPKLKYLGWTGNLKNKKVLNLN